jgi:prolyl oligopeptidase
MPMQKRFRFVAVTFVAALTLASCATQQRAASDDPYLWLEGVQDPAALAWAEARNAETLPRFESDPRYKRFYDITLKILEDKDKIPFVSLRGNWVYNFWQDQKNVRGVWRRALVNEFIRSRPRWELLLDLDKLAAAERENWVYKGSNCLAPDFRHCLLTLSRGGTDASVVREFDVVRRAFVGSGLTTETQRGLRSEASWGFQLPEAKSRLDWWDKDTLLVATDFGPDTLTDSGYPRQLKIWKRGQPLSEAKLLFEGKKQDVSVYVSTNDRADTPPWTLISRSLSFYTSEYALWDGKGKPAPVAVPEDAEFQGFYQGQLLFLSRKGWEQQSVPQGAAFAFDPKSSKTTVIFAPDQRSSIVLLSTSRDHIYVQTLTDVRSRILKFRGRAGGISAPGPAAFERLPFDTDEKLDFEISSADAQTEELLVESTSFLEPDSLFLFHDGKPSPRPIKKLQDYFMTSDLQFEQKFATSKDGTRVPYFIVRKKNARFDGTTPTLLYGYGGFESSMTASYLGATGKIWLEQGGAYVLANIRGGGEYGPTWHQSALGKNRQRAFDDFIAIAEDLISSKLTSPKHLGIMGGSNGGLLVGAVFVQRPELFNAVVCQVPLLDMERYAQLLAGASWVGEYGDPNDTEMLAYLRSYSPYAQVKAGVRYPEVFFLTSTADDRVHPGHARKMVARMKEQGHTVYYFENTEGGHGAAANLRQRARRTALQFVYLFKMLDK